MLDNECKINVLVLYCNETYLFPYNIKTTEPGKLLDLRVFYIDNF